MLKQVPQLAKKARVYDGTAWQELASAQTDLTAYSTTAQMNTAITDGVGLVPILTQTIGTAVSSVVVNNAFSADYDAYKIIVSGGVSSLTTTINMRLAGITTGYYGLLTYQSWGSSTVAGISTSNVAQWAWVGAATTVGSSVNCDVINPFLTTRKVFSSSFVETDSGGLGAFARGYVSSLASATGFSLFPSSGTLTGGTIRVYGYKN